MEMSKYQKVEKRSWSQLSQSGKKQVSTNCGVVGDSPMVNPRTQRSLGHQALNVTNSAFTIYRIKKKNVTENTIIGQT